MKLMKQWHNELLDKTNEIAFQNRIYTSEEGLFN